MNLFFFLCLGLFMGNDNYTHDALALADHILLHLLANANIGTLMNKSSCIVVSRIETRI